MQLITVNSEENVIEELCKLIESLASKAIASNGKFRVGLSGGSLIKYLSQGLPKITTDWSKWQLFFCDERFVPDSDADSTFGSYNAMLVKNIPSLKAEQFVNINVDLELDECARDYEEKIREAFCMSEGIPSFDLLLLGMGPDGHTCSLFPGHPACNNNETLSGPLIVPIYDSPKPPPRRVTMTFPLINTAQCCVFAMAGQGKAEMVKRVLKDKENLPAGSVNPENGELYWIIDEAAGSLLWVSQ